MPLDRGPGRLVDVLGEHVDGHRALRACRASSPHLACWPHWAVPPCLLDLARPDLNSRVL